MKNQLINANAPRASNRRFDEVAGAIASLRRRTELWMLACVLVCELLTYALNLRELYQIINLFGPFALTVILLGACYQIVQSSRIAVWSPLFWFRISCAAYFGFGALVPHVVNDVTRQNIYSLYNFDPEQNLKVNLICVMGIFLTLAFSYIMLPFKLKSPLRTVQIHYSALGINRSLLFALIFIIIGGVMRYVIIIPYTFSIADNVLPGLYISLAKIYYVGIYLLVSHAVDRGRGYLAIAFALIAIDLTVSVASFAKTELLLLMVFILLALLNNAKRSVIAIGGIAVIFAYLTFQPLVDYGRSELQFRYGEIRGAGLEERLAIVADWAGGGRRAVNDDRQIGLLRLSYMNVNAFVVHQYDVGLPGDTLQDAAAVLVPRIFWPSKPIISDLGQDLYFSLTQLTISRSGVGHFAEAYWNFGWIGIVPYMAVLAMILSIFTRVSLPIMARSDWIMLPLVFLGVNIGLRVDGHAVADTLGPTVLAIAFGASLLFLKLVLRLRSYNY